MVQKFAGPAVKMVGNSLPHLPWEDRPSGSNSVVWRYRCRPIIQRDATPTSNSIFNSAAVPSIKKFAGVFRLDDTRRIKTLHVGHSDDGVNWQIDELSDFIKTNSEL